jgi:tRNA pseudouridine38-40 synthase
MRYFAQIAYNGTRFKGWQTQPNGISVQETIENALTTIFRTPTEILGCGRTDTGVHAAHYIFHFDYENPKSSTPNAQSPISNPQSLITRLNHLCGSDIAFYTIWEMTDEAHARFDATSRSYYYTIKTEKTPFEQETAYFYPNAKHTDIAKMQACAQLLLKFDEFLPFCKTNAQNATNKCTLTRCEWVFEADKWTFHITANRFLRGMIRLIVGACLQVGNGKMTLAQIQTALETQTALPQPLSAPAEGLFLHDIQYPSALFVKKLS